MGEAEEGGDSEEDFLKSFAASLEGKGVVLCRFRNGLMSLECRQCP